MLLAFVNAASLQLASTYFVGQPAALNRRLCTAHMCDTTPATQATCNAIMSGLVRTLLPMFVRDLGKDYVKWATTPEYRAARAARSKPLTS